MAIRRVQQHEIKEKQKQHSQKKIDHSMAQIKIDKIMAQRKIDNIMAQRQKAVVKTHELYQAYNSLCKRNSFRHKYQQWCSNQSTL